MAQPRPKDKQPVPLRNVWNLLAATQDAKDYCAQHSGMFVVFHGHAGYGKTQACNFVRGKVNGYRVECLPHWGRKALLQAILYEMSIPAKGTLSDLFNLAYVQLMTSGRPLLLDEADHLVKNSTLEMVRGLMDQSGVAVILSGEETLPQKLKTWERIDSRVLKLVPAVPADMDDVTQLAQLYCPGVELAADWLAELFAQTGGNTRRVVVNLNHARTQADFLGPKIDLANWGDIGWYTKDRPVPRRAV